MATGRRRISGVLAAASFAGLCLVATAGCGAKGGGADATAACGPVQREVLDPRSIQHVLPNAPTPTYLTDPPTSGPHQPSPPIHGVQTSAIPKPVQVGLLEGGNVLVQYRALSDRSLTTVRSLAGTKVVVAPNPDLRDGRVVLTSWLYKQTCSSVDVRAAHRFVSEHANRGPDHPNG
ncbi:MAG TPA: DUF3105 domain-containing protein [Acidimicrobiales bacterium]|jgi:hypothetical protein|nr:DUF3105 domain-containing protein [Acidimicrobiales bacterium]